MMMRKKNDMTNITGYAVRLNNLWYMVDNIEMTFLHKSFTIENANYRSNYDPEYLEPKHVIPIAKMVLNGLFGNKHFYVVYTDDTMQEILL